MSRGHAPIKDQRDVYHVFKQTLALNLTLKPEHFPPPLPPSLVESLQIRHKVVRSGASKQTSAATAICSLKAKWMAAEGEKLTPWAG